VTRPAVPLSQPAIPTFRGGGEDDHLGALLHLRQAQVIGNKWDMYLDLLQADYTEG